MVGGHHHPWRRFRGLVGWTLHWRHLPDGFLGVTDYRRRTVTLTHGMTQAERRSTIAHEVAHIERGPSPAWLLEREERLVDEIAARRLIAAEDLADALLWSRDDHELADELWVDVATVRARLASLSPEESAYIEDRLDVAGLP